MREQKIRAASDRQIAGVLAKFETKCAPGAPLKNRPARGKSPAFVDVSCSNCERTLSGWMRIVKSRKKKNKDDPRWSWGSCEHCGSHATCGRLECRAEAQAHEIACGPSPSGAVRQQ